MSSSAEELLLPPEVSALIPPEEWYEPWLRAGLYVGAAFQLLCILAVLVLPEEKEENKAAGEEGHRLDEQEVSTGVG